MPYKKLRWLFSCLLAVLCLLTVLSAQADPVFQVTLKSSKITLSAGETKIIDYTVTASSDVLDKTLTFASSSTDIVTVDSMGQLTAKSVGYANITITHAAEPKVELTCQVEVVSSSTMALNLYSVVLPINGTVQLTATTSSAALPVTYSTSDPKVCTVDASTGIVKAVGEGTAQILAANAHGVKAVCEVKVSKTKPDGAVTPTPAPTTPPSGGQAAFVNTVSGSLNLRSAPSLYATVLRTIPEKAAFTVLEYGSDWCKAQYGSTVGYVMTKFVRLASDPAPVTPTPTTPVTPAGQATVQTPSGSLNMRVNPWVGASRIRLIPRKAVVDILVYGSEWCYVRYKGDEGYVMTKFLSVGSGGGSSSGGSSTATFAQVVTGGGGLNLRKKASTGSTRLLIIPEGMLVQVQSKGSEWCKVTFNGVTGYVKTNFLKF